MGFQDFEKKVQDIESCRKRISPDNNAANAYTLHSLRDHIDEIHELLTSGDPHWKAETMDVLIHCLLLLRRNGCLIKDIDALFKRRSGRFVEKITEIKKNHD